MIKGDNIVPIFVTPEQLARNEQEVEQWFAKEGEAAYPKINAAQAVIDGDADLLSKCAETEIGLAKPHVDRYGATAEYEAMKTLVRKLKDLADRRNERLHGASELAKRAMSFASARERRYHGPVASVTNITEARK